MGNRSLDDFVSDAGSPADEEPTADTDEAVDEHGSPGDAGTDTAADAGTDADADDGSDAGTDADADADGGQGRTGGEGAPRVDPATVDPAASTYAWSGDGRECESCGETAERRWKSDDGLVCPDCKEW